MFFCSLDGVLTHNEKNRDVVGMKNYLLFGGDKKQEFMTKIFSAQG